MSPGLGSLLGETRVVREYLAFAGEALRGSRAGAQATAPKAVLLIPGLMAGDPTLYPLARRLRAIGCRVFFSGIWWNTDCPSRTLERLERGLREAARITDSRVIVIGHSLGGIYARELAGRFPLLVERAILLGSPLKNPVESANELLRTFANVLRIARPPCIATLGKPCEACGIGLPGKLPKVPETIIYTKSDGVVDWRSCLEEGPNVETIAVRSSHCGLGASAEAWAAIENRVRNAPPERRIGAVSKYRLFRSRPAIVKIPTEPRSKPTWRRTINQAGVVIAHLRCGICGSDLTDRPAGDRTLGLGSAGRRNAYFFCRACGENILGRVQSDDARKRYQWFWAVPCETTNVRSLPDRVLPLSEQRV
jgi:pimeloyl-ACP methyl ester carboxylesterase